MSDRAVKVKDLGLTQVYCSEKPLVDIVFVHGLNGHPHRTWSASNVFWPADLLPPMLNQHRVRILTYGYNASVVAFTDGVSRDRVHNHAETLASALAANRNLRGCSDRPIIFVCHSLGGLVVKRALIYCRSVSNEKIEHLRSIFVSTYGILFLGTPHNGSDIAKWGLLLQNICSAVLPKKVMDTSGDLVKALRTNNETLQNINSLFADIIGRFHIFFFHETRPTDVKGTRDMIVDESSAAPYIDGVERSGIDADHSHMCKFEDDNAPGFESVADALFRYARDAPHAILDRWVEEGKTRLIARQAKAREIFNNENMSPSPSGHHVHSIENSPDRLASKEIESSEPVLSDSTVIGTIPHASSRESLFVAPTGFHPNATFFGMTRELDILHSRLFRAKKRAERLVAVLICGGPGSGKSHLARQYVFTHRDCYPGGIFWVDAKSRESTSKCFWDIAQAATLTDELEFESPDSKAPQKYVEVVRNWFQAREEWLLVFDGLNFDHEDDLNHFKQFLPFNKQCSIVYTSVDQTLRKKQRLYEPYCLQAPPLTVEDACKLLFKDLGIKRPTKEQIRKGTEVVNHYECLPLAIHAISHRLSAMSKPIEKYHIDSHLTDEKLAEPFLSIMRDLFRMNHLEALSLINILSFLGHHVPVGLINLGRPALEVLNVQILTSNRPGEQPDIDTTLGILIRYGLIERTSDAYALHPRNFSPQSEKDNILEAGDLIPDLSESQTESSQEAFFSVYQNAGSIDVIKIHSVVQGFCRDELKIMDEEMRKQSNRLDTHKYTEDYYPSWLVVATRVLYRSYENAKRRMDHVDDYGLVKDYREYETQASRLNEHFPKRRLSEPKIVREARADLKQMLKSISIAIQRLSPSSSQDSIRKHRSVFDRSSSSSSSMPDSSFDDGPSRQLTWDWNDMVAVKVESPKEMPPPAHQFNLSPFLPHIFRESSSEREGYESDNEHLLGEPRLSPAHSHISQSTEKPSPSQPTSPPRDDRGWQVVEKPQKARPGKKRQPKQRPKFPRHIQGARLAAPILEVFPVEGRSISNSSLDKGRSSSSVSAAEALTAVHNASSPRTSEEDIHWIGTENGPGNKENSRTWAAVAAKPKRASDISSPIKRGSSSSLGAEIRPNFLATQPLRGGSSVESLDIRPSTSQGPSPPREIQIERMSRSTYSEPSQDYLAQHLNALDLRAAPESRYHARHLSTVAPMAAAPLRDMSASSPSLLPYYPPPIPYENQIEITVARRLNATAQQIPVPAPAPVSQPATGLSSIPHPSAIMPGASPPSSLMADMVGYAGYISDPPPVLEPMSRGPSGQSQQSWSTEPVRFPPRFPPMPATGAPMASFMPQQQTLSGAGSWIGDVVQPSGFGAAMSADVAFAARTQTRSARSLDNSLHGRDFGWEGEPVPSIALPPSETTLHFGAHQVDLRDARQRLEMSSRYLAQVPSAPAYHLYHSNRSGPLIRPTQEMAIPGPAQGAYGRRARSGSSPLNPEFHHLNSNL